MIQRAARFVFRPVKAALEGGAYFIRCFSVAWKQTHACRDCGEFGLGHMLDNDVWASLLTDEERQEHPSGGPNDPTKPSLLLCLQCCEVRLGRPITSDDLAAVPINRPLNYVFDNARDAST